MALSDIKLIVFDLGRVLVQLCDGWRHACDVAGVRAPARDLDDAGKAAMHDVVCAHEVAAIDQAEFCRRASELLGLECEHVSAISDVYLRGIFPGATDLLRDLLAAGYQTACLSNTNASHWQQMFHEREGINLLPNDLLTHRFGSQELRLRKPDDAIYAHVERATNLRGEQIVFFDDLLDNITAAQRRGWHAYQIEVGPDPVKQARKHLASHRILVK